MECNELIEFVLSIVAIIFGGGVLGKLIEFFVKRSDEQKANKIDLYKNLYNQLCKYSSWLEFTLLDYFKNVHSHCNTIEGKCNVIKEKIAQINTLKKQVASFHRKCKKGKYNEETCQLCTQKRKELSCLFETLNLEYATIENLSSNKFNYWMYHSEQIQKGLCDYMNMRKILLLTNCKDNELLVLINSVDRQTLILSHNLLSSKVTNNDFSEKLVSQMENIEYCLLKLSKNFK